MNWNPLLDQYRQIMEKLPPDFTQVAVRDRMISQLRHTYSYSMVNDRALQMIAKHTGLLGKILEVGAGNGYLAEVLHRNSPYLRVTATDIQPYQNVFLDGARRWHTVHRISAVRAVQRYVGFNVLLMSWPPYRDLNDRLDPHSGAFSYHALKEWKGNIFVYIGEPENGCTGTPAFHKLLREEWTAIDGCAIPQWPDEHDELVIYGRKL